MKISLEKKSADFINILVREYIQLIGLDGVGFLSFLIKNEYSGSLGNIKLKEVSKVLLIKEEDIKIILKKIEICNLIELKKISEDRFTYKIKDFVSVSYSEKLHFLDNIFKENIISQEKKSEIEEILKIQHNNVFTFEKEKVVKKLSGIVKNVDLQKIEKLRNPDSFPALVFYYYNLLSKTFEANYVSKNIQKEASILKRNMRKNGDSPDMVRKMFNYIISDAKNKNHFAKVSTMSLYESMRNEAFYNVNNPKEQFMKQGKIDENTDMKYIEEMYDYWKEKGIENDIIVKDILSKQFSEDNIKKFLDSQQLSLEA